MRVAVLALLAACGKPPAIPVASNTITTRDSAGVAIVEHPAGALSQAPRFRLGAPTVTIGGSKADALREMSFVTSALFLGADRFIVADDRAYRVVLFDSAGTPLGSYGRHGDGPGEFRDRPAPHRADDGSIWLLDRPARLIRLSPELLLRTDISLAVSASSDQLLLPVRDGALLAVRRAPILPTQLDESVQRNREFLVRITATGSDTLASWPGLDWYPIKAGDSTAGLLGYRDVEFGRKTIVKLWGNRLVVGTNQGWAFDVHDSTGVLRMRVALAEPARLVTEAMRDSIKARQRAAVGSRFADSVAHYEDVIGAADGALWVAETVVPTENVRRFAVFNTAGHLTRRVEMPARYRLLAADGDRVLVRRLDQNGVAYLDLARLIAVSP